MLHYFKNFFASLKLANNAYFVGRQLRNPNGLFAAKVAEGMNESNKNIYGLIFDNLEIDDGDRLLEIGFGNGYFFNALSQKNNSVKLYGIETSKEMIRQCGKLNKQLIADNKLEISHVSNSVLPYPDQYFDKAIAINLIYFWENPMENIEELSRVLKNQGRLYIGIRPYNVISQLPFAKTHFNVQQDNWWIELFEKFGFQLSSHSSITEPPLQFNGNAYEMSGVYWMFQKV